MEKQIARSIVYFYFDKNNENFDAATEEIKSLAIHKVEYNNDISAHHNFPTRITYR